MLTDAQLGRLRAIEMTQMKSRVTIRRRRRDANGSQVRTTGPDGYEVPAWDTIATNVPFQLLGPQGAAATYRTVKVGDTEVQVATKTGKLPAKTALRDDDWIEGIAGDSNGQVFRVVESSGADRQTALRVPVIEVDRPEEWT